MTATETASTKLIVNVTPADMTALTQAADNTGLSRTDTVSRALVLYNLVVDTAPGGFFRFERPDGSWAGIRVTDAPAPAAEEVVTA